MDDNKKIIHECNELKQSDNRLIEIEYNYKFKEFELTEYIDDAVVHGIKYCPFCGVTLTKLD